MKKRIDKITKAFVMLFGIFAFVLLVWSLIYFDAFRNLKTTLYGTDNALDMTDRSIRMVLQKMFPADVTVDGSTMAGYAYAWNKTNDFYRFAQSFDHALCIFSIVMIVLWAVTLIIGNHSRSKYFLSNLVSGCALSMVGIIYGIVILVKNAQVGSLFNQNKEFLNVYDLIYRLTPTVAIRYANDGTLLNYVELKNSPTTITTLLVIIFICISIANLVCTILKYIVSNRKVVQD